LSLGVRNFRQALAAHGAREEVLLALEQPTGAVTRLELDVFPQGAGRDADNLRFVSWMLDGLLWACGGCRVVMGGPPGLCRGIMEGFGPSGGRPFHREIMAQAFGRALEVAQVDLQDVPASRPAPLALGGHLEGCRIGFDLGASDYKVAAVRDGEVVFSAELPWDPKVERDPAYHVGRIQAGLELAASHLPRVDAIGGSSAGILVDNQIRVASLFRAVPREAFDAQVRPLFLRLRKDWGVPLEVLNDGDVTALAGGLSLGLNGILGIALGSSEAVGFLDGRGRITGWLNELAFGCVDANPEAGTDDWSGNPGAGAAYFSQQAVNRLAGPAGIAFPETMAIPDRLKDIQARLERGDGAAREIFETIGVYLGYTLPWYREFYDLKHAMILGRVTSGPGGELILAKAREVLAAEFPLMAGQVSLFLPDEKSRRVGQAVAAASLPPL
jgi:predicted NBD/HSP70 family sugar kinase